MIRFINGIGSGGQISSHYDIRVQIIHDVREGYLPSADGGEIREEMPLMEFLGRIFKEGREVENELYRMSSCLSGGHYYNNDEISRVTHKYDTMYSELIRKGKLVLAQHKMSHKMIGGIDPYDLERRQLMSGTEQMDRDHYRRQAMMQQMVAPPPHFSSGILGLGGDTDMDKAIKDEAKRANDEKKKRSDDLFYLTT